MRTLVARLRTAGCVFAEDEADLLIADARDPEHLEEFARQRIDGLPLEHVVGWAEFDGRRIELDRRVFVPRHRTEFLVEQARALTQPGAVVLDACCGSGAVGVSLLADVAGVTLIASDVEPAAVRCARRNLTPVGGIVFQGDLYDALPGSLRGRIETIVANAPYVPTGDIELLPREARLHEPRVALDGGLDGLDIQRRVAAGAGAWLAPGGHLLLETSLAQSSRSLELCARSGLAARITHSPDLDATVVIAQAAR